MWRSIRYLAAAAIFVTLSAVASAYEVKPMIYDLKPSGREASKVLRVKNTSGNPITIEMKVARRSFDEKGREQRTPAEDDFVIFPPQTVIPPGVTQSVRVQYVGRAELKQSVAYAITVAQVPVKLPTDQRTGLKFVFNFSTAANVVPAGAKAKVETVSLTPTGKSLRLMVRNSGNKYANLSSSSVALGQVVIEGEAWRKALGPGWLLPGATRVIDLPLPGGATTTASAKFQFVETAL